MTNIHEKDPLNIFNRYLFQLVVDEKFETYYPYILSKDVLLIDINTIEKIN